MTHLRMCAVVIVVLTALAVGSTASAHQKPWSQRSNEQKIMVVLGNIKHQRDVLAWYRAYPGRMACKGKTVHWLARHNCGMTVMQRVNLEGLVAKHKRLLRRAQRTLARLQWLAANSGPIPWYWNNLHNCEQPGSWQNGGGPGATFSGGLGIHRDVWSQIAGQLGLPSAAWYASPWQQIRVARVIMHQYGAGAWAGCAPKAQAVMNQEHIS